MNKWLAAGIAVLAAVLPGMAVASPAAPVGAAAPVVPAQLQASGPYTANATGELVTLTVAEIPNVLTAANVGLVHSEAVVDSDGPVNGDAALRSSARAANLDPLEVVGIDVSGLLTELVASAPPSESLSDELLTTEGSPLAPIANLSAANADVQANWASDTECVSSETPTSMARNEVATLEVLDDVISLTPQGAVNIISTTSLPAIDDSPTDPRAVQAQSVAQTAGINVGGENGLLIEVVGDPTLTATATGLPGGASVSYEAPLIRINGEDILTNQQLEDAIVDPLLNALLPLLDILRPLVDISVTMNEVTSVAEPDGTHASADASVISINVSLLEGAVELLDLQVIPMHADATAPAGGITCGERDNPLREVHKGVSAAVVAPGGTFNYTVAVPNRDETCTLTNVRVVDTVTGPAGFTIVGTVPPASSIDGGVITWDDIGPLAPNETKTLVITVQVPANAPNGATFSDFVDVSALCDGEEFERPAQIRDIPEVRRLAGPCDYSQSNKETSHVEVFPGETFNYRVNVANFGAEPCTGVTVTDTLDSRVTFVSCTAQTGITCTNSGQTVTWNVGTLAGGSSVQLVVTVQVNADATGTLENVAVIDSNEQPPVTVRVTGPEITDRSVLAGINPPAPGRELAPTGLNGPWWLLSGAAGLALMFGLRQLRRRAALG